MSQTHYNNKEESSRPISPFTGGWMEKKLNPDSIKYLWDVIESKGEVLNGFPNSYRLEDKDGHFYQSVLDPLMLEFINNFGNPGDKIAVNSPHPYCLHNWWVDYQRQGEYKPIYDNFGCFTFVIFMKIPYLSEEGTKDGSFEFRYSDLYGQSQAFTYDMGKPLEGTLLLFPSNLKHQVYPFYNNDEDRISISGNIVLNTSRGIPVEMNADQQKVGSKIVSLPHNTTKKIGEYKYPPSDDINNELFDIIQELGSGKEGVTPVEANCTMTDWDLYTSQEHVKTMVDWVKDIIDNEFNPPEHDVKTVETWAVTYKEGEDIKWHKHGVSCYSFVYYVNVPEGSSPFLFKLPDFYRDLEGIIDPKPGKVVIFESRLEHSVPPNKCEGRCAISGNIFLKKHE